MSVQTQIDRISGNVAAALSAIAEKGVTVPDGSNSDALAELIASIEAGGGLPDGITAIATGTYTPAGDLRTGTIEHGLGVTPSFFFMCADVRVSASDTKYVVMDYASRDKTCFSAFRQEPSSSSSYRYSGKLLLPSQPPMHNESSVTIDCIYNDTTGFFGGGMQYRWIAGVWA